MTITKVGNCTGGGNGDTSNNNSVSLGLPAGCNPGDILVTVDSECSGSNTLTTTGNNVLRGPVYSGSVSVHYVQWRALSSGDISAGSLTRQWSGAGRPSASGSVFRGVDTTKITIDGGVTNDVTSQASKVAPGITTTVNLSVVLIMVTARAGTTPGPVSSIASLYTKEFEAIVNQAGFATSSSSIHRQTTPGAAGAVSGPTVNFSPNSAGTMISTVALAPLPDATGYRHMWNGSMWVPMTTLIGT
jgi:hypothetical protein